VTGKTRNEFGSGSYRVDKSTGDLYFEPDSLDDMRRAAVAKVLEALGIKDADNSMPTPPESLQ
jgi:3-polyprenyl-4-hydroxybenzoate decarboxylase